MKAFRLAALAFAFYCSCMVTPALKAQADASGDPSKQTTADLIRRLQDVEKEVGALRGQVAELKQQSANGLRPCTSSPAVAADAVPATVASPQAEVAPVASRVPGNTTLSGFLDTYYAYNFNQSRSSGLRAFDGPANQFALNLIEVNLDRPPEASNSRFGYHLGIGFGQAMNVVNGGDPAGMAFAQYLKEGYFSYLAPLGRGLRIDLGKFVTPHGAEVIETKDNWNYSRGLLFTYAIPYYHYGARVKYSFGDKYSVAGLVVNGWNNMGDNNAGKTYAVVFGWNPAKNLSVSQTYMAGPENAAGHPHWRQLSDTVVTYSPVPRLTTMLNVDYGRGDRMAGVAHPVSWSGLAGYLRYAFNERYAVAARYEYYDDPDGFTTGTAQHVHEFTGTLQRAVAHHLIGRLEYRHDHSTRPVFRTGDALVPTQDTIAAGVVYIFETRESN